MNMDVHTKKQRSFNMSQIRSTHTKPETIITHLLDDLYIPYTNHDTKLPGTPDFYIQHFNLVIEVMGCFWHGHNNCKYFVMPKTNKRFWENKIKSNTVRDTKNLKSLSRMGIRVLRIWECQIKNGIYFEKILRNLK